jgi:2-deoxy-D-gluconate 3-dehydrogenase
MRFVQLESISNSAEIYGWYVSKVLRVNLDAVFVLARDIGAYMLTRLPGKDAPHRGSIINVASLVSFQGGLNVPAYAAAKGGVAQLTKSLSNQWASRGINVNAVRRHFCSGWFLSCRCGWRGYQIAPGHIHTDMNDALVNDEQRAASILERIPAGRWGRPDDFKGPTVFLASRASSYVSGEILTVDGG